MPRNTPRLQHRGPAPAPQLPLSPLAEAIRDNIAERVANLTALEPAAIDLAATVLAELHQRLHGRCVELRGPHTPEYRRQQHLGKTSLPLERLCYLAIHAPHDLAGGLAVLARQCGYALVPNELSPTGSLAAEGADVSRAAGELSAELLEALEDGRVEPDEARQLFARIDDLKRETAELEVAVQRAIG